VIVVFGTPGLAALQQATRTIPIVFAQVSDPVSRGFVASAARPGGNITGFSDYEYTFAAKWVELLKEISPRVKRAAVVYGGEKLGAMFFAPLRSAAPAIGVQAEGLIVNSAAEVTRGIAVLAGGTDAGLIVLAGSTTLRLRHDIIEQSGRRRLPAVYPYRAFAFSGGLVSYGADIPAMYQGAASYVDRILRGARPSELPVQFATKFDLVVNLRTAKAIGLAVPQSILARADEVIE
jgi:putative ABC transport system substrate-binding protein